MELKIVKNVLAGYHPSIHCETEVSFKFLHFECYYKTLWPTHLVENKTLGEPIEEVGEGQTRRNVFGKVHSLQRNPEICEIQIIQTRSTT